MVEVRIVKDGDKMMGVEFRENGDFYFISARQDYWPGLRLGKFPNRIDGNFEREIVKIFCDDRDAGLVT